MFSFVYIAIWVLPCVLAGVFVGYRLGRTGAPPEEPRKDANAAPNQEQALKLLTSVLAATEKLTSNVDTHNHELEEVGREVGGLQVTSDFEQVQSAIVQRIATVIESNKRLEDDLVCTRYQLENQAQELDRQRREARTDALSGAANRKAFDECLKYHLSAFNLQGEKFALVLLDVDHFKWINDTHGHPAGDLVVQNVAAYLKQLVRGHDMVFRFGGDEFAVLLTKIDDATALHTAQRIRQSLAQRNFDIGAGTEQVSVTCSLGLTTVRPHDTAKAILARSDEALYRSKRGGRNQVNSDLETLPEAAVPEANAASGSPQAPVSAPVSLEHDQVQSAAAAIAASWNMPTP